MNEKINIFLSHKLDERIEDLFLIKLIKNIHSVRDNLEIGGAPLNISIVSDIHSADFVMVPHAIDNDRRETQEFLNKVKEISEQNKKKTIIVVGGDLSHNLRFDGFLVFRGTTYKNLIRDNDIIVPPFCEDLGIRYGLEYRHKNTNMPVIGFCGWAGFANRSLFFKYILRNVINEIASLFRGSNYRVFKKGLYFRRKCISAIKKSDLVKSNIIIRDSFLGRLSDISNQKESRKEYAENMKNSDFILAPKGDANYSVRFFEALSIGRIPLLIDTDMVLPIEDKIPYDDFVVRVSYKDIDKIPEIISNLYEGKTDEELISMQKKAREVFERYLNYSNFFNQCFGELKKKYE